MDIEKFENLIKQRAEDSLDLKLDDKSWQDFKNVHLKTKRRAPFLFYLLSFFLIASFSFLTGIYFANYQNKEFSNNTGTKKITIEDPGVLIDHFNSPNDSQVIPNNTDDNTLSAGKNDSHDNQRSTKPQYKYDKKAANSTTNNLSFGDKKSFVSDNIPYVADNVTSDSEMLEYKNVVENINNQKPQHPLGFSVEKTELNTNSEVKSDVITPLFKTIAELKISNTFKLKHGIEPTKEKNIYQNYLYLGGLVFIKEHEQNYVGWRFGYYHEVKKNFRLFGSVYKVNDEVELGTQIIPEHYPAPQPGLEIEHIHINKSTYVLPFGLNYTYPKFKIKPFVSLGFAPEYAKINKVKYQYKNTSDNIPEETKIVNIKTSNFYLYSDFGHQGPVYDKFDWKVSMHFLNYLSGHEDGAENEDNFKSYLNAGLIFKL